MAEIIRINLTTKEVKKEEVPEKYKLLGGRALTSQMLLDEVDPQVHPLSADNKLIFAPGLLSGTRAPSSGRLSVGAKSPLTGGIKESNAGGITSQKLANLGIKALVLEGKTDGKYLIKIDTQGVELIDAPETAFKGTYELTADMRAKYGEKVGVICVGPAGEYGGAMAGIATNDSEGNSSRYAGRGGLGAVMGTKGVKAIVIDAPAMFDAPVANEEAFKEAAKKFARILLDHPVSGQGLPAYGTNVLMNILNEAGALPTANFSSGRFDAANQISGEKLSEIAEARGGQATHACHPGCVIRCSNVYPLPNGKVCSPIEYESAWSLGAHCKIGSLDDVGELNYICNDVGIDTIEAGGTLGVLMEAGVIPWGDAEKAKEALIEIGKGTAFGRIVGNGAAFAGKAYAVERVAVVKGQHLPAYDPRGAKGIGVTYATSPQGGDHTAGYSITANILKVGGLVDPLNKEGQVDLSRNLQIATAAVDATGLCLFVAFALLDNPEGLPTVVDMINAQYATELTVDNVVELGKSILRNEKAFNAGAGFNKEHDRLPKFLLDETLDTHGAKWDITDAELDETLNF